MYTQIEAKSIINELTARIAAIFPNDQPDVVLFGSYARNTQQEGSDIDVLYLIDAPRDVIASHQWQIGDAAAEILLKYNVLISPVVENRAWYEHHLGTLPFFRNIQREGVRVGA